MVMPCIWYSAISNCWNLLLNDIRTARMVSRKICGVLRPFNLKPMQPVYLFDKADPSIFVFAY